MKSTSCIVSKTILNSIYTYSVKHSLQTHSIPENLYTSTDDVVTKLGVPIAKEEMNISYKLYNEKNHSKSIIVKFINYKKKAQPYRKRTELKHRHVRPARVIFFVN